MIEGFYQGEEEERRIEDEIKPIFSRKNFIESKRIEDEFLNGGNSSLFLTMTVIGRTFLVQLKF